MSSLHPGARTEAVMPVSSPVTPWVSHDRRLDLKPFDELLPLLTADVEAVYGPGCRLAPLAVYERLYSHVLRVGVWHAGDDGPREHLFVKASKYKVVDGSPDGMRKRVEKDFAVTQRVFDRMAGGESYGAVRPIACYPAHLAIVTEEVPGNTLLNVVENRLRWSFDPSRSAVLRDVFVAAGRWIRDFQEP